MASMVRILLATIKAGGGHIAVSYAVQQALQRYYSEVETEISDYMLEVGAEAFDKQHKEGWKRMLTMPWSARWGQHCIDALPAATRLVERQLLRPFAKMAAADLAQRPVDMVVSSHGLLTMGLSLAQREYGMQQPVITCSSETNNISAYWADTWAQEIIVPNTTIQGYLQRLGMPAKVINVVGYPVQQAFLQTIPKASARQHLQLDNRFTILLSLGGEGIGNQTISMVQSLHQHFADSNIVIMCGRNDALKEEIRALELEHVRAQGFSREMHYFLAAADVVIAKSGIASVYESLAMGRALIINSYVGLNEKHLVDWLVKEELGHYAASLPEIIEIIRGYQAQPDQLEHIQQRCQSLDLEHKTQHVADAIMRFARDFA